MEMLISSLENQLTSFRAPECDIFSHPDEANDIAVGIEMDQPRTLEAALASLNIERAKTKRLTDDLDSRNRMIEYLHQQVVQATRPGLIDQALEELHNSEKFTINLILQYLNFQQISFIYKAGLFTIKGNMRVSKKRCRIT
jgi:hypothetical protein